MSPAKRVDPPQRRRTPPRPYARKRGGPPSVTTILDVLGKPGLPWGAAKETARFAVLHRDEWDTLDTDSAIDRLRKHHRGLWDGRAAMGTLVHHVNEAWTWGETVELEHVVARILGDPRPPIIWRGREEQVIAEAVGYVDGLEAFWRDFTPMTVATEEVVRHPDRFGAYIGQRDWVAEIDGERWLIDIKTTAEQDGEKGLYADSWRLQLAAYRHAEEIVFYDEDGAECGTHPNYLIARCGVVHLRGDGGYVLYELAAGGTEWNRFLQARGMWEWMQKESKTPAPAAVAPKTREAVAV